MTGRNEPKDYRFEFTTTDQSIASVIGPSIGIGMIAFIAGGAAFMVLGAIVSSVDLPEDLMVALGLLFSAGVGICAATKFIQWRRKVIRERKLVIDRDGITHFVFADKKDVTRWDEIERVEERETLDSEREFTWTLHIYRRRRRPLRIVWDEFFDYGGIKLLISRRLPDKTTTVQPGSSSYLDASALSRALGEWGFPGRNSKHHES